SMYFGTSVSLNVDTAIVGANGATPGGAAYVYVRNGMTWPLQQKLVASDAATADNFGTSVSVDVDTAIVGANADDDKGTSSGSPYTFSRSGNTWTQQQKLLASDGVASDYFGVSVALKGTTAVVGAWGRDDAGTDTGAAYVFSFEQKLTDGSACAQNSEC